MWWKICEEWYVRRYVRKVCEKGMRERYVRKGMWGKECGKGMWGKLCETDLWERYVKLVCEKVSTATRYWNQSEYQMISKHHNRSKHHHHTQWHHLIRDWMQHPKMSGAQRRRQNQFVTRHNMPGILVPVSVLLSICATCTIIGAWKVSLDFTWRLIFFFISISPFTFDDATSSYNIGWFPYLTCCNRLIKSSKMVIIVNCRHHGWHPPPSSSAFVEWITRVFHYHK